MKKKPWVSAILNFFLYGAGYLYNGKKKGFGVMLILAWIVLRTADILFFLNGTDQNTWFILMAGLALLQIIFAYDGYQEARSINSSLD